MKTLPEMYDDLAKQNERLNIENEALIKQLAEIRAIWDRCRGNATSLHLAMLGHFDAARKGEDKP